MSSYFLIDFNPNLSGAHVRRVAGWYKKWRERKFFNVQTNRHRRMDRDGRSSRCLAASSYSGIPGFVNNLHSC
jgi:hypothetical protein